MPKTRRRLENRGTYDGGILPELTVTGYAPLRLRTYYPIISDYPYTGHSKLDIPINDDVWYDYVGEKSSSDRTSPYVTIDKKSNASDYNFITNNCANATLNYLTSAFRIKESPYLFTTPGDVRSYAINKLNGKIVNNADGSDTVLIPRNKSNSKRMSKLALDMFDKDLKGTAYVSYKGPFKYKDGGIYIKPSKRGTFTAAATKHGMGVQEFASKVLRNKEDYSPSLVKKANFARNASKWH